MSEFVKTHKRLSVAQVRSNYWDRKRKRGKKIKIKTGQDLNTYGTYVATIYFVPDGDLVEERGGTYILHEDWLSSSRSGPYKRNEKSRSFFYLTGKVQNKPYRLQICSRPLNVLSEDCLDAIDCWVER